MDGTTPPPRRARRRALVVDAAVAVGVLLVAVYATWPLGAHLTDRVPKNLWDPLENAWIFGWGAHAVLEQPRALFQANIFFPSRYTLAYAENMLGVSVPVAPVFWASGNAVLAVNVGTLLVYTVGAFALYLLVRDLTRSRAAGVVAGVAFTVAPYRVWSVDHVHVIAIHLLPLALLLLTRIARGPTPRRLALLALLVGAQVWTSLTGTVITLTAIGVFGLWELARRRGRAVRPLALAAAATVVGLALGLPVISAYRSAQRLNPEYTHPDIEVIDNSATPGAYLFPPPGGELADDVYDDLAEEFAPARAPGEKILFPGFVLGTAALATIAAAAVAARRRRLDEQAIEGLGLAVSLGAVAFVLSLGPRWGAREDGAPLPFDAIAKVVEGLTRVPARFGQLVLVALAIGVGVGVSLVPRRRRLAVAAAVVGLLALEALPGNLTYVEPPPIEAAHRAVSEGEGAVLALPTLELREDGSLIIESVLRDAIQIYLSTAHFEPTVNGYGAFIPKPYADITRAVQQFPTADSIGFLHRVGVTTVLVQRDLVAQSRWAGVEQALREWPGVRLVAESRSAVVFDISRA